MPIDPVTAQVGLSVLGGLFGSKQAGRGSQVSQQAVQRAREIAPYATFRPYTVTTSMGQQGYNPMTGQQYSMMTPEYQQLLNQSLAGASNIYGQLGSFDPAQRAQEIYKEQEALLQPSFQQQATDLQSKLFGSGRLGLKLAGESQGLGAGSGMVQPDALGLGQAQQQTLAQLAAGSREQALGEMSQLQGIAGNMLQSGLGITGTEAELIKLGVDAETARAASQYAAGNLEMQPYGAAATAAQNAADSRMGLFGGITSGLLGTPGLFSGGANTSRFLNPMAQMSGNSVFMNDPTFGRVYFD